MCSVCGRSNSNQQRVYNRIAQKANAETACELTMEEVLLVQNRLTCFKSKFPNHPNINSYLGIVESLLNTKDFCMFELQTIIESLDGSTC